MVSSWMLTRVSLSMHTTLCTMIQRPGARLRIHGNGWSHHHQPAHPCRHLSLPTVCHCLSSTVLSFSAPSGIIPSISPSSLLPQALACGFTNPAIWFVWQVSSVGPENHVFLFMRKMAVCDSLCHLLSPLLSLCSWCKRHTEDPAIIFSQALVLLQESYWLREWRWWTFQKSYRQKMIDVFSIPNTHTTLGILQNIVTFGLQTEHKNWNQRMYACTGK